MHFLNLNLFCAVLHTCLTFLDEIAVSSVLSQALDGFLVALTTDGNIIYVSDSVSSLIGHLPVSYTTKNYFYSPGYTYCKQLVVTIV